MRRPAIPALMAIFIAVMLTMSALPQRWAEAAPAPTASPREFAVLAPDGQLNESAVKAESAILMDSRTGKVLFEKNADAKQYPASTTKVMTCLLAIEKGKLSDLVTVGKLPKLEKGSTIINLKQGETMTLEDMLYGLMMHSGNDAAQAVAIYIGGSIEGFAAMMNEKALELGMTNTHYVNPHGLQNTEHYTTVRDMATLAIAARKYPEFAKIVSTYKYTIPATNKTNTPRQMINSNKLISQSPTEIYAYKYATGIKTGYTTTAKSALVSSATKDSLDLVAVVMRDSALEKWTDCITMFEYAFTFYDTLNLSEMMASQTLTIPVPEASEADANKGQLDLQLLSDKPVYITDRTDKIEKLKADIKQFEQKVTLIPDLKAPITRDQELGTVTFSLDGAPVLTCKLLACRDVNSKSPAKGSELPQKSNKPQNNVPTENLKQNTAGAWLIAVGAVILLLLAAMLAIRYINLRRRGSKMRQYNFRKRSGTGRKH